MATFTSGQVLTAAQMNLAAGDSGWINVSGGVGFQNSWAVSGVYTVSYRLIGQTVFLRGRITGGSANIAFTLPAGYRIAQSSFFCIWDNTASAGKRLSIDTSGNVTPSTATNVQCLDGVSFSIN
jgi:hypothetical protein